MPSSRRSINNLGDVQIALNDLFDQLDKLTSKAQTFNGRLLTGIADATNATDAVNLETMQTYVMGQIEGLKLLIPPKSLKPPANSITVSFNKSLLPSITATFSIGSSTLAWLKGWFANLNISSLTASLPVKTDASKNLVTGAINLASSTEVTGTLPVAKGGTGDSTLTAHAVLLGEGTSGISFASPSTANFVLTDNGVGVDPSFKVLPTGYTGFSVQTIFTALTRPLNTVQQNTGTKSLFVKVWATKTTGGTIQFLTDNVSTPTTVVDDATIPATASYAVSVCAIVLPGNYYEITLSSGVWGGWIEVS